MSDKHVTDVLSAQLPEYFRPVLELQEILKACGYLLQQIEAETAHMRDNFYIASCDWRTIDYYEKLLGISGAKGLSLEERRSVVLMRYGMRPLYTLPMLKEMLGAAVGADQYSVICLPEKCQLTVILIDQDIGKVREIYDTVALLRPAHIQLFLKAEYVGESVVPIHYKNAIRMRMRFYPCLNLPPLHLDDSWVLDGRQSLDGYNNVDTVDLHLVGLRFSSSVHADAKEVSRLRIRSKTEIESGSATVLRIRNKAKQDISYPVSMAFGSLTHIDAKTVSHLRIQSKIKIKLRSGEEIRFLSRAGHDIETEACARIRFSVTCPVGNRAAMHQENYMDDAWVLDGERCLDGDDYTL